MGDINIPHQLAKFEAGFELVATLQQLGTGWGDTSQKIKDDIKAFHALNDTEKKKHADALALIDKHSSILTETQRVAEQNKKERESLEHDKVFFQSEVQKERAKITEGVNKNSTEASRIKALHEEAVGIRNSVDSREESLRIALEDHAKEVTKLESDKKEIAHQRVEIEGMKKAAQNMLDQMKEKQEALKQFNF